jgi:dipeptidase E
MPGTPFFSWPGKYVQDFLGPRKVKALFIPYAAVTLSFDEYALLVQKTFEKLGYSLTSIHLAEKPEKAVVDADVIVTGGGNSFALLSRLYQHNLVSLIQDKVINNTPYIGWSAGANVACPTIMTTNDMPINYPPSFEALNVVPFQINPHYTDFKQAGHGGETRQQRIEEFLVLNSGRKVIGLPEGMLLHREQSHLSLRGEGQCVLFQHENELMKLGPESDLNFLLPH